MRWLSSRIAEAFSIALLPIVLVACALLRFKFSGLMIFIVAILCLGMLFANWESSKPGLRQIVPVAVMSAIAAAGRIVFAALPSVQPVTAICVIAGASFGRREGFIVGALAAFVSNCFLGQGIWTPWQMYSWGLVGYLAGVLFSNGYAKTCNNARHNDIGIAQDLLRTKRMESIRQDILVCIFGFFAAYIFSIIMNTWTVIWFSDGLSSASILAIYASGFAFDTAHAISTVAFLAILYPSWERKLSRIKRKYALGI